MRKVNLIVAYDNKCGIGRNGSIPWYCKEDIEFFKETTKGAAVIFGKNTWHSLKTSLAHRVNIIISKTLWTNHTQDDGNYYYPTLTSALEQWPNKPIFICGGTRLYKEAIKLDIVDTFYLSHIKGNFDCDTFFPYQEMMSFFYRKNPTIDFLKNSAKIDITRVRIL